MRLPVELRKLGFSVICVYANTGLENDETLDFINKCDKYFDLGVNWIEAVVHENKGNTHRVVSYETAFRVKDYKHPDHPYHAHVRKNGIPNQTYKQCSDRLKQIPIEHWKKVNGYSGLKHALGMRADEHNRVLPANIRKALSGFGVDVEAFISSENRLSMLEGVDSDTLKIASSYDKKRKKFGLVYPFYEWLNIDKQDINDWWDDMPFNLALEEHEGNCQTCWKKSNNKLSLLAIEHPERFEAMKWFEDNYSHVKPNNNGERRVFFRGNRSAEMIIGEVSLYDAFTLRKMIGLNKDADSGCSESCEAY